MGAFRNEPERNKSKRAAQTSPKSTPAVKKMAVSATPAKQGVFDGKIVPNFPSSSGPVAASGGRGRDQPVHHPAPVAAAMTLAGMTLGGLVAGPGRVAAGGGADLAIPGQRTLISFFGE